MDGALHDLALIVMEVPSMMMTSGLADWTKHHVHVGYLTPGQALALLLKLTKVPLLEHAASTLRSCLLSCISAFVCVHTGLLTTKVVLPIVLFDFKLFIEIPNTLVTNHVGRLSKDWP